MQVLPPPKVKKRADLHERDFRLTMMMKLSVFEISEKTPHFQTGFRVDLGSPFVHLTKFHRFSASFFGARLFILAISAPDSSILLQFDKNAPSSKRVANFENLSLSRPPRTTRLSWPLARNGPGPTKWAKKNCQAHIFLSG